MEDDLALCVLVHAALGIEELALSCKDLEPEP